MSPAVSMFLLHALIDDFSSIPRSGVSVDAKRAARPGSAACVGSPTIGRRVIEAEDCGNGVEGSSFGGPDVPVLIHGSAAKALTAWRSAAALWPTVGIDVAPERERRSVESVHRGLALLTELPRTVPVTVGLTMEASWRDALDLILARGRSVRFSVCGVDAPDAPAMVDAIRAAVSERCAFSWSSGPWQAVTDTWEGPLPGILNVLLATAAALRGADAAEVGAELARTDPVDVVDSVCELDEATAQQIRALLSGFAVREVGRVVDSLCDLELLPKSRQD